MAPNGRLDVLYYDRRADRTNVLNEVSLQASFDEGKTFLPRVEVSDRAFSSRIGTGAERKLPDLGSRLGLVSTDTRATAYGPTRAAAACAPASRTSPAASSAFNDPPRLSSAAETALRLGGIVLILLGAAVALAAVARRRRTA